MRRFRTFPLSPLTLRDEYFFFKKHTRCEARDKTLIIKSDSFHDVLFNAATNPTQRVLTIHFALFVLREQALKKRLGMIHDSLSTALSDGPANRKDNAEQIARLTQAHR